MTTILGYLGKPFPELITDITYKAVDYLRSQPKVEQAKVEQQEVVTTTPEAPVVQKESDELAVHLETPSSLVRAKELTEAFKDVESVSVSVEKKQPDATKSTASKSRSHGHHRHHNHHKYNNKK